MMSTFWKSLAAIALGLGLAVCFGAPACALADDDFERPPIEYSKAAPENAVARLLAEIESGAAPLKFDAKQGYLPALLEYLDIPIESQVLVFSKTSLQRNKISPQTPRAIYFNDDIYVGFCQNGDVLEISVADPKLGAVFYTIDQTAPDRTTLLRQTDNCLICHSSSRTGGAPGHLVRSLFVDAAGLPILSAGSHTVDHTTPFEKRWGGWYVSGTHGKQTHQGNLVLPVRTDPHEVDNSKGQNVADLTKLAKLDGYLSPHSDIVALMVLEHQTLVHNRLTQANFAARQALAYQQMMNEALGEPVDNRLDSTTRRIASAGDALVEALLMVDEAELTDRVQGTSGYAEQFTERGPRDADGRSLREFDLERRLFKYPCSFLIYSESFDKLPGEMKSYVWQRLWNVVSGEDQSETFAHLSPADRQAIREIIRDTKPNLPDYWK